MTSEGQADTSSNEREHETSVPEDEESDDNERELETSVPEDEESNDEVQNVLEVSTPSLPSALRSAEKKSDRSNLSVSFAVDVVRHDLTSDTKCSKTTADSEMEQTETIH
ncbi:hypothetical protein OSTOST_15588, partial [Ostertagia ostertagi]